MQTTLITEIGQTMDELIKTFSLFAHEQIDTVPFDGSWTAGEVAEHIIKSIVSLPQLFAHNLEQTIDRTYDANVPAIRKMFLDFTTKMQSPGFILPQQKHHDKEAILKSFDELKTQTINTAASVDLTLTCKMAEFPGFGYLTTLEWLNFAIVHTQRHTNQLKNIYEALQKK